MNPFHDEEERLTFERHLQGLEDLNCRIYWEPQRLDIFLPDEIRTIAAPFERRQLWRAVIKAARAVDLQPQDLPEDVQNSS